MRCVTTPKDNREEVITEVYTDKECYQASTDLQSLKGGEFAPYRSGPFSIYWFFIIMAGVAYTTFQILMKRRNSILNEVYSKLSIVKTKN